MTTTGQVRAVVVDATSRNLRALVLTDGIGRRTLDPHAANRFAKGEDGVTARPR